MSLDKDTVEQAASELVALTIEKQGLDKKIRALKGQILEYTDLENINDISWLVDNGCVEITTETKYRLADVPAEFKVAHEVAAVDVAQKAFKTKVVLTKEGKQMFKEQHPSIVKLMIPNVKKRLKVIN